MMSSKVTTIAQTANSAEFLLPEKSKFQNEMVHKQFKLYRLKSVENISENVRLAYLEE